MGDAMDHPDDPPSTRDPFGNIPYPGTPPTEGEPPYSGPHELVGSTGEPPSLQECACGLRIEGPDCVRMMEDHIFWSSVEDGVVPDPGHPVSGCEECQELPEVTKEQIAVLKRLASSRNVDQVERDAILAALKLCESREQ